MADRRYALLGHVHLAGSGTVTWGSLTGTLADQSDLQAALDAKLNLSGGTLTGDLNTGSYNVYIGGGKLAYNTETFSYDGDSIPQYGLVYYSDSVFGGVSGGMSGYYGLSFFTGSNQRLAITTSGTVHPGGDKTQDLGSATKRWSYIYGENLISDGSANALWFNARNGGGANYAWYNPDGTEAKLYRSGIGDILTVSSAGALYSSGSVQAPKFYAVQGRHDGYLNASLDGMVMGQGAPILGDGIWQDHIAFRARSNCEYLPTGGSWTAQTDSYDAVFDGRLGGGYNGNYTIPSGHDGVRWTWTSVGYVFVDSIVVMGSTAGNNITIKAENSSDGVVWNEMRTSNAASSWPGAHVFYVQGNTSAGTSYYRITITRTHENANNVEIGHIRSVGIYGGGQRLFDWNYARKLTFANRIEISGSNYEVNPTGAVVGQYTSTVGYIQAPGGASGVVDIWTGGTSTMARFGNSEITLYRHTAPSPDNSVNLGNGTYGYAGVYATSLCSTYLWDKAGAKRAIDMYDSWLRLNEAGHFTSGVYTPYLLRADGGFKMGTSGGTTWAQGAGTSGRVTTSYGYCEIGPQNGGFCHMITDLSQFYFNVQTMFGGTVYDYNGGTYRPYLKLASPTGYTSGGNVTFSTSAASGGNSGDIWFQYA